jgi:hypothetical protein
MQHSPHLDSIPKVDIEDQVRVSGARPEAQTRQVQFVSVPRGSGPRGATNMGVRLVDCIDEAFSGLFRDLKVVIECIKDILVGAGAAHQGLEALTGHDAVSGSL